MGKKTLLIPVMSLIVGLFSFVTATAAWFTASQRVNVEVGNIAAVAMGADLESVSLIKFDYPEFSVGDETLIDYLAPENGTVSTYPFNETEQKFGKTVDGEFEACDVMNLYDPLDILISGKDLASLNCNVIYEVKLNVGAGASATIRAKSDLFTKTAGEGELNASTCIDFDFYSPSDLNSESLMDGETKLYIPDFIEAGRVLTETEETYYKLSYLSHLDDEHKNFYEDDVDNVDLGSKTVTADENGIVTIYVNANYSVEQLERYATTMSFEVIRVVFDYKFVFTVDTGEVVSNEEN